MRVIEKKMLEAIKAKKDWMLDNTAVNYISAQESGNPYGSRSEVFLHGNHIATYWHGDTAKGIDTTGAGNAEVNVRTLQRWPSPTTKSRLRALGVSVYTRKGVTYLNDKAI